MRWTHTETHRKSRNPRVDAACLSVPKIPKAVPLLQAFLHCLSYFSILLRNLRWLLSLVFTLAILAWASVSWIFVTWTQEAIRPVQRLQNIKFLMAKNRDNHCLANSVFWVCFKINNFPRKSANVPAYGREVSHKAADFSANTGTSQFPHAQQLQSPPASKLCFYLTLICGKLDNICTLTEVHTHTHTHLPAFNTTTCRPGSNSSSNSIILLHW